MPDQRTGHIDSGPWSFDFEVSDHEGLSLINVKFRNILIMAKGSIPVIRVRYVHDWQWWFPPRDCGPFADQITWKLKGTVGDILRGITSGGPHHLVRMPSCGNEFICGRSFISDGVRWQELGVYARIGAYHLYQVWYLSDDGVILPRLFSKGLSCNFDHIHHPYWRLDFDIEGPGNNRVLHRDNGVWFFYPNEVNDVKIPAVGRVWFVQNQRTGRGVWIRPGPTDGVPDSFAPIDVGVRLFHDAEDQGWPWGASGGLELLNGESVANSDVVFWYVAHLNHKASEGGDAWHHAGPTIQVQL